MKRTARTQATSCGADARAVGIDRNMILGSSITIGAQIGKSAVYLISTVALARALAPEDFGLFAIVTAFTNFLLLFKDLGLSAATIQREEIDQAQISALFWINAISGALLMLLVALCAPILAKLYSDARLCPVTLALSVNLFLSSLTVQHQALLKRQMRFLTLAMIDLLPLAAGTAIAIVAALQGLRYWALVAMSLTSSASAVLVTWIACRWRPSLRPPQTPVREMIRFGGYLTGSNIINYFSRNADNMLIGWYWGAQQLGFYDRAYQLMFLPIYLINTPLSFVAIPLLSRLRKTPESYEEAYLKLLRLTSLLAMPLVIFLLVTADWTISLLLGPQWGETSRIFRWLGLAALVQPLANTTGWLFISQGRTRELMWWNLASSAISLLSIIAGLPWGPLGVAISYSLSYLMLNAPLLLCFIQRIAIFDSKKLPRGLLLACGQSFALLVALITLRYSLPGLSKTSAWLLALSLTLSSVLYFLLRARYIAALSR